MRTKILLFILLFLSLVGFGPFVSLHDTVKRSLTDSNFDMEKTIKTIRSQATNLDAKVLRTSLTIHLKAKKRGLNKKQILTIVDYSKPSTERRLWVIDLKNLKVLLNTWVSHGKNSGAVRPTSFSNQPKSLKSSLGVFLTGESYYGGHGYSLRVKGLEPNINNNAESRAIVFHSASYVSPAIANNRGMIGRSWGCFAVNQTIIKPLIDAIKNNTLLVAYYPDENWFRTSSFMH